MAKETGTSLVIINTDSEGVADLVNKKKDSRTPIFWVISEIQELINEFIECKVKFAPRPCNVSSISQTCLGV